MPRQVGKGLGKGRHQTPLRRAWGRGRGDLGRWNSKLGPCCLYARGQLSRLRHAGAAQVHSQSQLQAKRSSPSALRSVHRATSQASGLSGNRISHMECSQARSPGQGTSRAERDWRSQGWTLSGSASAGSVTECWSLKPVPEPDAGNSPAHGSIDTSTCTAADSSPRNRFGKRREPRSKTVYGVRCHGEVRGPLAAEGRLVGKGHHDWRMLA